MKEGNKAHNRISVSPLSMEGFLVIKVNFVLWRDTSNSNSSIAAKKDL